MGDRYDLVIAGGGMAGSALAVVMARSGAKVLVVEKERAFRDRVRGELLMPWGTAEARRLGLEETLLRCAVKLPGQVAYMNGLARPRRDFPTTTPDATVAMGFFHPHMQETLLRAAAAAGAEVWRGSAVLAVTAGERPGADVRTADGVKSVEARLIVGADGRDSPIGSLAGFARRRDATELFIGGFQLEGSPLADDAMHFFLDSRNGRGSILVRTADDNHRIYLLHHKDALPRRLSGARDYDDAMNHVDAIGVPRAWLKSARPHGVFASFDGAHQWIDAPARDGIVLVGDAAGASDPVWGNGLSRTLRDVRMLRDLLLDDSDWLRAAAAYAIAHDVQFHRLRRSERLHAALFFAMGEEGERRRERAFAIMDREPDLFPDLVGLGPDAPLDDAAVGRLLQQ